MNQISAWGSQSICSYMRVFTVLLFQKNRWINSNIKTLSLSGWASTKQIQTCTYLFVAWCGQTFCIQNLKNVLLHCLFDRNLQIPPSPSPNREFKIRRLRTTATDKYATAHDHNHVTVHFSRVVLRLRWVVELFRAVGTTENILLVFCHLGNSRISSFRKKVFNLPPLSEREAKYGSCV